MQLMTEWTRGLMNGIVLQIVTRYMRFSEKHRGPFGGSYNKDHSILRPILGPMIFRKSVYKPSIGYWAG